METIQDLLKELIKEHGSILRHQPRDLQALVIEKLGVLKARATCANHTLLFKLRGEDIPSKDADAKGKSPVLF